MERGAAHKTACKLHGRGSGSGGGWFKCTRCKAGFSFLLLLLLLLRHRHRLASTRKSFSSQNNPFKEARQTQHERTASCRLMFNSEKEEEEEGGDTKEKSLPPASPQPYYIYKIRERLHTQRQRTGKARLDKCQCLLRRSSRPPPLRLLCTYQARAADFHHNEIPRAYTWVNSLSQTLSHRVHSHSVCVTSFKIQTDNEILSSLKWKMKKPFASEILESILILSFPVI